MPTYFGLQSNRPYRNGFLSIGNFDGVHLGHQAILAQLVQNAKASQAPTTVLTFDPHPIQLLRPGVIPPKLTTIDEKADLILNCGVDHVVVYPTDRELLELSPEQFFNQIVLEHFEAQGLIEGPNFFFGKDRAGTTLTLNELCKANQLSLEIVTPKLLNEQMISSSEIRSALREGAISSASQQLGRRYSISGVVVEGDKRGRLIGFPTANLGNIETQIPKEGVYAANATLDHETWKAAVNIGANPTFGIKTPKIEAHLLDYQGDLYGKKIRLDFIERIRDVQTFESVDALKEQLTRDIINIRHH